MQSRQLIIGQKYKTILNEGSEFKSNIIWIPDNPFVDERLSGHADLAIFNYNGYIYAHNYLKNTLNLKNCTFIDEYLSKKYPDDVKFNICSIGDFVILNEKYVSEKLLERIECKGSKIINVKQGYCKCNTLVLNNNSIITSDPGIYSSAVYNGIQALKIRQGFIRLDGFEYGFIGGCGVMLDNETLLLTGILDNHPDKDAICIFCSERKIKFKYLTELPIFDIGGIIKAG